MYRSRMIELVNVDVLTLRLSNRQEVLDLSSEKDPFLMKISKFLKIPYIVEQEYSPEKSTIVL